MLPPLRSHLPSRVVSGVERRCRKGKQTCRRVKEDRGNPDLSPCSMPNAKFANHKALHYGSPPGHERLQTIANAAVYHSDDESGLQRKHLSGLTQRACLPSLSSKYRQLS